MLASIVKTSCKTISFILVIVLIFSTSTPDVWAINNITQKKKELYNINLQIKNKKKQLETLKQKEISVINEVKKIDNLLEEISENIDDINEKISKKEQEIQEIKFEIENLNKEIESLINKKNKRIIEIYKNGGYKKNNILLLFNALLEGKGILEIANAMNDVFKIIENDTKIIQELNQKLKLLHDKKQILEFEQKELEELKNSNKLKEKYLQEQIQNKQNYLKTLYAEKKKLEQILNDLEKTSKQIEKIIKQLQNSRGRAYVPLKPKKGMFGLPVKGGYITSPYGWRYHPILKKKKMHTGLDIGRGYNTPILASQSGIVIYAGMMGGYGKVVIIDHGNGWTTLYAHNNKLLVKKGDKVIKGQQIAKMGSTGYSTGPHLHFEIRKNGKHLNPMNYL